MSSPEPMPQTGGDKRSEPRDGAERERRLFLDEPLPMEFLKTMDIDASVRLSDIQMPYRKYKDYSINLGLTDGRLQFSALGHAGIYQEFSLEYRANTGARAADHQLKLEIKKLQLKPLLEPTRLSGMVEGELDLAADLAGKGNSIAAIMGSLDGEILESLEDARADVAAVDRIIGGVTAVLGQMVKPGEKLAVVNCGLTDVKIEKGKARVRSLLDTEFSTIWGEGDIDLGTEQIDLLVTPKPKGVTLSVATPVVVSGPLAAPGFKVQEGGLLTTLADLTLKFALPQVMVADVFGLDAQDNPCFQMVTGEPAATPGKTEVPGEAVLKSITGP